MNCDSLAKTIRAKNIRKEEDCKDIIKQNFSKSKEDVSIDKMIVSLLCNVDL